MAKWITNIVNRLNFKKENRENIVEEIPVQKKLTIQDIEVFDDVYIKLNNKLYEAWVTLKNANNIFVCYDRENEPCEVSFNIRGLYNHSTIVDDKKLLILNKEDV